MSNQDEMIASKAFGPFEIKDAEQGEVTAKVAKLNVVDKDGDVILPGAIPAGGVKVKLSGYAHDIITKREAPVGKGVVTEEGEHLIFRGKFFLSTARGQEAFHTVRELGADSEWSIGFNPRVKTAALTKEWEAKGAQRLIAGLQMFEASPVIVGAGVDTATVDVKAAGPTASVDGVDHPAGDFAYVPDAETPSTWKLPIFDADHVRNALARLDQADIPEPALPEVKKRLRAAAARFSVDAASLEKDSAIESPQPSEDELERYRRNQDACLTR